ncbi:MAG: hypothetical protein E7479_03360 [Ruminococcaceae bacterium]|nr:hypothetical protein [Oscillospiraceae bacterium]
MKKFLSIILAILMLCSCVPNEEQPGISFEPSAEAKTPPDVKVQYGDISITAGKGTYSWQYENGDGTATAVEADSSHPTAWNEIPSFSAGTGKTAKLIFDESMISFELTCYDMGKDYVPEEAGTKNDVKSEKIECEDGFFEIPEGGKVYIYELYVKYKSGSCHYGFRIDSPDEWGLTLSVSDVTATGLTVIFTQSGGNPTGELMTGSYYRIESADGELAYIVEGEIAWTAEAYMIPKDGSVSMNVNWEWLYGVLEPGTYKIFKGVSDFRGPGDYDDKEYSAEFTVGGKETKNLSLMKIVDGAETGKLVLAPENSGDVMTLNVKDIPVFLDGKKADASALMDGMTVHVYHNGEILETWPACFGKVEKIEAFSIGTKNQVGGTLFDLCGLYLKVLDDLWEVDSGLNGGAEYVSIDLSEAPGGLKASEISAICWIFENKYGVQALTFTYEELIENGYLTAAGGSKDLYQWDNGVLLSITGNREEGEKPDAYFGLRTIEFDAMKWRSPLGAYIFDDCTAAWPQMGTWEDYSIGSQAIS